MANIISDETIEYVGIFSKTGTFRMKKKKSRQKKIWEVCSIILTN